MEGEGEIGKKEVALGKKRRGGGGATEEARELTVMVDADKRSRRLERSPEQGKQGQGSRRATTKTNQRRARFLRGTAQAIEGWDRFDEVTGTI